MAIRALDGANNVNKSKIMNQNKEEQLTYTPHQVWSVACFDCSVRPFLSQTVQTRLKHQTLQWAPFKIALSCKRAQKIELQEFHP